MGAADWKTGLERIAPGVYADGAGGMHLDSEELLQANGWPATAENVAMLETTLRFLARLLERMA